MPLSKALEFIHAASISEELRNACSNYSKEKLLLKYKTGIFNFFVYEKA